jgi:hypothetical protein
MGMVLCLRGASLDVVETLRADTALADNFLFDQAAYEAEELIDFDKAWHALHFLFTGTAEESSLPLSLLPDKAEQVGTDNGYGPPWILSPAQVAAFHAAFSVLTDADLAARYDPEAMAAAQVYLADSLVDEGDEGFEYVMQSVPQLRALMQRWADAGWSVVGIIT